MNNQEINYELIANLFIENQKVKEKENKNINQFKKMYNLIRKYEGQFFKYDEIITNSDIRHAFLVMSVIKSFENEEMDANTKNIIFQMYEEIYDYLYKDSELSEIEIPEGIIANLFNRTIIPNESELKIIMTLIRENKNIFDNEIKGKYFSQMLDQGLHTGIIKELKIEEENLSHLLGLTNDGSLYEFYRKTMLDNEITKILNSLGFISFQDQNFNLEQFNIKFKEKFGLDYSEENRKKIINWRYNATEDYLKKRGISVTDEEKECLNQHYSYALKSQTLNFYCTSNADIMLEEENSKIREFVCEYIRKEIIEKCKIKKNINELQKIFTYKELELICNLKVDNNSNSITNLIDKYIEQRKIKLDEDKEFKTSFINKFEYSFPLLNYYELLSKNISFYNFSLFKNLNSIIVDYDSFGKKIESDVFLVSYSHNKFKNIMDTIIKIIDEKDKKYEESITSDNVDKTLDHKYIMNLLSLLSFKEEYRYYFRYGFISKDKQKQDDQIIIDNSSKAHNITLIGFKAGQDEINRLKSLEMKNRKKVKHFLKCETNITSNYYQYITDFTRYGIEYPIDILEERGELPYNRKRKILKIIKPLDKLNIYITQFEICKLNIINESQNGFQYMLQLRDIIYRIIDDYIDMTNIKISVMRYRLETRNINEQEIYQYRLNIEQEQATFNNLFNILNRYKEYIDESINKLKNVKKRKR